MNSNWKIDDIPDLSGKVYIVTGSNTGLGLKSVELLSRAGASVILTSRNLTQGQQVAEELSRSSTKGQITARQLDLTSSDSIKQFSDFVTANFDRLDGLINNAAVVNLANLSRTKSGLEMHMATNHLGHFELTYYLFELLINTPHSRVVTVSSGGYRAGKIDFDDINWQNRPYSRVGAYADSKLANLLFMQGLQERFDKAQSTSVSVAAHPGLTASKRQQTIGVGGLLAKYLASSLTTGVAPQLFAATAPDVTKCAYYGPKYGIWGSPKKAPLKGAANDLALAQALWQYSELTTGCYYPHL